MGEYDIGKYQNGTYTNDYFGFSLDIPGNWKVIPLSEYSKRPDKYKELLKQKIDNLDNNAEHYETIFVLEKDTTNDTLFSYIIIMTEPADEWDKINVNSARDYFEYTKQHVNKDHPDKYPIYEFSDLKTQSTIGGQEFLTQGTFIWIDEESKYNRISYCRKIGDYFLLVIIDGFGWKAEMKDAKNLLRTIKWK